MNVSPGDRPAVGYFWNRELAGHDPGYRCLEKPIRCQVLDPGNIRGDSGGVHRSFLARESDLPALVHHPDHIAAVREAHQQGRRSLDAGDTVVTADVFDQALLAASAGCDAADQVLRGDLSAAFCAIRPPGHHANRVRSFGFCIFNNAAIAAVYAQTTHGVGRILIVDWDVHPGNGAQEIFWEDPSVFTLSFHQDDLFPESGRADLVGEGAGQGTNRNVPMRRFIDPEEYRNLFDRTVGEVAAAFRPELLIIAAGFDAHRQDAAAQFLLQADDFAALTRIVLDATRPFTGGRTLSFLEGGYDPGALRESVAAHFRELAAGCGPG